MVKFTPQEVSEIEVYGSLIASGVCDYTELALGRAHYRGQRIGVDVNSPSRPAMLAAIRAVAAAKGYDGPALPEADPSAAVRRRALLLELLADAPQDDAWLDRRDFYVSHLADAPLDDANALLGLLTRLRAAYQPPAAPTPASEAPNAAAEASQPWSALRPDPRATATYACALGNHVFGPPDARGWRSCHACGVTTTITEESGAYDMSHPRFKGVAIDA